MGQACGIDTLNVMEGAAVPHSLSTPAGGPQTTEHQLLPPPTLSRPPQGVWRPLPPAFNAQRGIRRHHPQLWSALWPQVSIIHFTDGKPWQQGHPGRSVLLLSGGQSCGRRLPLSPH